MGKSQQPSLMKPRCAERWRAPASNSSTIMATGAIFVVFTLRRRGDDILIRPISARYMHDKEVKSYEKENPNL